MKVKEGVEVAKRGSREGSGEAIASLAYLGQGPCADKEPIKPKSASSQRTANAYTLVTALRMVKKLFYVKKVQ